MPAWFYQGTPHMLVWVLLVLLVASVAAVFIVMRSWANGLSFEAPPRISYDECAFGSPAWADTARAAVSISRRRDMHALIQEIDLQPEQVTA